MKQGRASTSGMASTKVEPKSKAVNIEHAADMGIHHVNHRSVPMYEGRGLKAPMAGSTTHPKGSQKHHR